MYLTVAESKATYDEIKTYVKAKTEDSKQPQCPPEKGKF